MPDRSGAAETPPHAVASSSDFGAVRRDPVVDGIVALAADLTEAPSACLWVFEGGRPSVKALVGLDAAGAAALAASLEAWSSEPMLSSEPMAVPDAVLDHRLRHHPLVTGPLRLRYWISVPLSSPEGEGFGALCAFGQSARIPPTARDLGRLRSLAALATDAFGQQRRDRAALAEADARTAAKSDLLADVSHEMRTPLNGIMGFSALLRRNGRLDRDAVQAVERIEEAARGLRTIVEDALDLSTFESGTVRLDGRPFSAPRLVEEAVAVVRADADRKGLGLVVELPDAAVGSLVGDPDRLRQVLFNLLSNAVKFTVTGAIRVTLSYGEEGPPDAPIPLSIAVEDSGVGLEEASLTRLFRRFAQADGTISRRFGGTGLGLSISKTLVEAMGGTIAVTSSPGVGSRFLVSLALPRAVEPRVRPVLPHAPQDLGRADLQGRAILLAEDTPMNQKLVLQMLEPLGAEVDVVADGAAALVAVAQRDYALVLMDMEMPVLGGLEATRRIRAMGGAFSHLPIVALTANVFPEHLELCREAGMDGHLTKPFGPDGLAAIVLRWARRLVPADGGAA